MSGLPEDWRDRVVGLLVAPDADLDAAGALFADDPRRSPARQLDIYREQIRLRLRRVLRGAVAGLAAYEGDAFQALADAYLDAHPPTSWTLHRLPNALPAFLAAHPTGDDARDAARRELLALDLAIANARRAADAVPLEGIDADTALGLAPGARVLDLSRPWHAWRRAVLGGEQVELPAQAPASVVIYRRAGQVRDQELDPTEALLLSAFATPRPLAEVIGAFAASQDDPASLLAKVGPWFQRFAERGWVVPEAGR